MGRASFLISWSFEPTFHDFLLIPLEIAKKLIFFKPYLAILYSKISTRWELQILLSKLSGVKHGQYLFSTIQVSSCIGWKNWGLGPTHMGPTYGVKMDLTVLFWTSVRRFNEPAVSMKNMQHEIFLSDYLKNYGFFFILERFIWQNYVK